MLRNDEPLRTRPRSKPWSLRLARRDRELLYLAAGREEITQSEFIRLAVRDRASKVLRGEASTS